ncbi:galactokinase [Actinokineospora cianjurensis]|uniref:GHMP kinase-like protein n=1 Tax=Actinokineospora cianjurensis TaxID=585224 RepID=A0A421BB43_9PSEU|nr:galactokinase family protein [Actinokineospora cianjurensis]RLK61569.1 GHMP kinase-like protein [Actinokineospora cianjurensis]
MTPADRAAERFREVHGHAPVGVWSAPGRVNLIGEHTDYNDGLVLPFALPHRVAVAASPRTDGHIAAITVGDDGIPQRADPVPVAALTPGRVTGWSAYVYGVAWSLRDAGYPVSANLLITGDIPAGAGLSSSHALQCAVALALLGLSDITPTPDTIPTSSPTPVPATALPPDGTPVASTTPASATPPSPPAIAPPSTPGGTTPGGTTPGGTTPGGTTPGGTTPGGTTPGAALAAAAGYVGAIGPSAGGGEGGGGRPSLEQVARWVQRSENDFVGAPTGLLDQTASLRCVAGHALFLDVRSGAAEHIPFDAPVLVIDTRVRHSLADSAYGDRRRGCERAAALLGVGSLREVDTDVDLSGLPEDLRPLVRHVVTENDRVLATVAALRAGTDIGPLLSASHASLRDDYRVSCRELDIAVEAAVGAGALGARMTGGGFGGSAIAVVPPAVDDAVRDAVRAAFADRSLTAPRLFAAAPSPGAGRDH